MGIQCFCLSPLQLFAIDTFHGYSSVSQQLWSVASLLLLNRFCWEKKKNVQKDVSYFFGCGVDLFKCFKIMFVFSNKDFHTCNLSVLIIMYCIQLTCYCSRTISHVCSLVGQFHQAAYSKQSSSTKFLLTQKTLSLQISVPLNPSHHLR